MRPRARRSTLRISLALFLCAALLLMPHVFVVSEAALGQRATRGAPPPRPGKPEGTFPNLDEVRRESHSEREPLAPIPSTIRSPKLPLQPWNGRRVGDPLPEGGGQIRRAHARRRLNTAPPPVLDDQFVQNFFTWVLLRAPSSSEATFWHDQLRVAYGQGQTSVKLAAVALGKTLFESAEYAARNRDDHWYVYDLYKAFLISLPGRAGLDLGLGLSYSSQVWTRSGPYIHFDEDNGFPSPGFHCYTPRWSPPCV